MIYIDDERMVDTVGGLAWNAGFLLGITPLGALTVLGGAAIALLNDYGAYKSGVSEGYDAFYKNR